MIDVSKLEKGIYELDVILRADNENYVIQEGNMEIK